MFLSLAIIFGFGLLGGIIFEKIHLPRIIWYLILGILIGPSLLNILDSTLLTISSYLRQIALVLILTRSGLSMDINELKRIGRPALLMCFIPASFEIIGVAIFAPILLGIPLFEALLLGSVLAAVSPAIVVPRMISLKEKGIGKKHQVPDLIMAGASCDDVFVIVLFYAFKSLSSQNKVNPLMFMNIPISIILGVLLGIGIGLLIHICFKKWKGKTNYKVIFLLAISFGLIALETVLKDYISISSLLAIVSISLVISKGNQIEAKEIEKKYNSLWSAFEILLFTLVGCQTDVNYAFSKNGIIILGVICIALVFRMVGVFVSILCSSFTNKEKLFIMISYLPKATVQASIGGIALSEGLESGELILTAAVVSILFTAPLGAILMDTLKSSLLSSDVFMDETTSLVNKDS